jgi:TolB-like protein
MKRTIILLCMTVINFAVLSSALYAVSSVAVIDFEGNNYITAQQATFMTTMFQGELVRTGRVEVVDRNSMDRIIAELKFQQSDWVNPERVRRFGQMIGADYLITGSFEMLGSQFYLSVQMLDIETARIVHSSRLMLATFDEYDWKVGSFAGEFARQFPQENRFIGEWSGGLEGYDFNIVLLHSNMCIISVKSTQGGITITEETNGTWSFDENTIRINGNFVNSRINGLGRINWTSIYTFTNSDNSSFNMMITPPGGSRQTRISFARIFR